MFSLKVKLLFWILNLISFSALADLIAIVVDEKSIIRDFFHYPELMEDSTFQIANSYFKRLDKSSHHNLLIFKLDLSIEYSGIVCQQAQKGWNCYHSSRYNNFTSCREITDLSYNDTSNLSTDLRLGYKCQSDSKVFIGSPFESNSISISSDYNEFTSYFSKKAIFSMISNSSSFICRTQEHSTNFRNEDLKILCYDKNTYLQKALNTISPIFFMSFQIKEPFTQYRAFQFESRIRDIMIEIANFDQNYVYLVHSEGYNLKCQFIDAHVSCRIRSEIIRISTLNITTCNFVICYHQTIVVEYIPTKSIPILFKRIEIKEITRGKIYLSSPIPFIFLAHHRPTVACVLEDISTGIGSILDSNHIECLFRSNIFLEKYVLKETKLLDEMIVFTFKMKQEFRRLEKIMFQISPIHPKLISPPAETKSDEANRGINPLDAIFSVPAYSSALITFDFRFLETFSDEFKYGSQWQIGITIGPEVTFDDTSYVDMPSFFLDESYNKAQVHEFIIMAYNDIKFKIEIIILDSKFITEKYLFVNSTSVKIIGPYRAKFGENVFFFSKLTQDLDAALPANPLPYTEGNVHPDYLFEYASISKSQLKQHPRINNKNYFKPEDLYWSFDTYVAMTYFPFFSNCEEFDTYIPFFSLMEQNENCKLVAPEDTSPIYPFSFGLNPVSDKCENVILNCMYDEDLTEEVDKPRWFDSGVMNLYYITKDPQPSSSMRDLEYNSNVDNFITVLIGGSFVSNKFPSTVTVNFGYFQWSQTEKRMVQAAITLSDFIELPENATTINYKLNFNYRGLGHTDLLIVFAFPWYVYLVFFLGIGGIGIGFLLTLLGYHYLVSR